jgi:hypothetical protein
VAHPTFQGTYLAEGPITLNSSLNLGTPRAGKYLPGDCAVRINANAAWRMYCAWQRCALEIVARGEAKKIRRQQHAIRDPKTIRRSGKGRAQASGDRQHDRAGKGWPHLHRDDQRPVSIQGRGHPADYKVGLELAIARGWLRKRGSGTYVKFTQAGADLFA